MESEEPLPKSMNPGCQITQTLLGPSLQSTRDPIDPGRRTIYNLWV